MKIKELRLLDILIKQGNDIIYEGKVKDLPENLKEREYENINFDGTKVIIEI